MTVDSPAGQLSGGKRTVTDLAICGGAPRFAPPISCSNLVRPDFASFLAYLEPAKQASEMTDGGPGVLLLEERLARFHEVAHCVSFGSGFWALALAMRALALEGKSEVVMPSLTYRRMSDVAAWAGLTPRFCDVDADSLALSAATVAPCIGPDTALVLAVHPIVNCCAVDELESLAEARSLPLLVDGVESCYERYAGRKVGTFGRAEVFSLHASKLLNGFEGGYLTTNDGALADELLRLRGDGVAGHGASEVLGLNANLSELHAAMALASLDDLEDQVVRNKVRYEAYRRVLEGVPGLRLLAFDESEPCSFKNIVVELEPSWPLPREVTLAALNADGVLARAYYAPALHHKATSYPTRYGELPVTDDLESRFALLPSGARVSVADIEALGDLLSFLADHAGELERATAR
jgi:dTDP-4-amino-4,6-dideoxygalactose transaminase